MVTSINGKRKMRASYTTKTQTINEPAESSQRFAELVISETTFKHVKHDLDKRMKELRCLYDIASISGAPDITLDKRFEEIVNLLPRAWQHPEITCVKITINDREFKTKNYGQTNQKQYSDIIVHGARAGMVEIGYLEMKPELDEGPFLTEERLLIDAVAERLGLITEHRQIEEALRESRDYLERLTNSMWDAVFSVKMPERVIEWANDSFRLIGYEPEECVGRTTKFLYPDESVFRDFGNKLKKPWQRERMYCTQSNH